MKAQGPAAKRGMRHPHAFPMLAQEAPEGDEAWTEIGPDLRHRLVSEAAYQRFVDRGCADGYDVDDRLAAEADVERELHVTRTSLEP